MDDMKVNVTVTPCMFHYGVSEHYSGSARFEPWQGLQQSGHDYK
jgi:hypothetical protein